MPRLSAATSTTPIDKKCLEMGISRSELSRRSGVPLPTLDAWGRRTRLPRNVYQLYKVAQVLGCHIEDIIEPELAEAEESRDE